MRGRSGAMLRIGEQTYRHLSITQARPSLGTASPVLAFFEVGGEKVAALVKMIWWGLALLEQTESSDKVHKKKKKSAKNLEGPSKKASRAIRLAVGRSGKDGRRRMVSGRRKCNELTRRIERTNPSSTPPSPPAPLRLRPSAARRHSACTP